MSISRAKGLKVVWTQLEAGSFTVRTPTGAKDLSLFQNVNVGTGDHPVAYSMGTEVKAAGS